MFWEIVKNIATILGCISTGGALLIAIFKPLRRLFVNAIAKRAQEQEMKDDIKSLSGKIDILLKDNKEMKTRLERVEKNVLENEADRIRAELFDYGNRCRRGIRLHPEEFEHIRDIFHKYKDVLHKNHEGETEFNFIYSYYNHQDFPAYHQQNGTHQNN